MAGVAAALIPVGLVGYGLEAGLIWRLAAVIFLLFDNGIILSFVNAYQPVRGTFPPDRLAVALAYSLEFLVQASLFAVALGIDFRNAPVL